MTAVIKFDCLLLCGAVPRRQKLFRPSVQYLKEAMLNVFDLLVCIWGRTEGTLRSNANVYDGSISLPKESLL